jgi:mannose-1-phosphate guanylyltransferase/mannose-1-phosphate guanylyltransferase/mannose-6-phosphate isomerase
MNVVDKPWGNELHYAINQRVTVKILNVKKGHRLSLQAHTKRTENWILISGEGKVTMNNETSVLLPTDNVLIPATTTHRFEAIKDSSILEITWGEYDERDIVRFEDDYGRNSPSL